MLDLRLLSTITTILFSFSLAYAGPSLVQESEPNDNSANSNHAGKTVLFSSNLHSALAGGNLSSSDSDYFEYYLYEGDSISISLEQKDGMQAKLYLKNDSLSTRDQDTGTSSTINRISNYIAEASGNYYIVCDHHTGSGNYDLIITSNNYGFHELEGASSSNGSFADAEYLHQFNTSNGNLEFAGTIGTSDSGDEDYYFFQMQEGQTFDLQVRTFNDLTPKVELFAGNLNSIESIENNTIDYSANFASVLVLEPGPYFLKVSGNSGQGLLGSYYISGNIDSPSGVAGEVEPNDNNTSGNPLYFSELFTGSNIFKASGLGSIGLTENTATNDYFTFEGNVGDQVTITNQTLTDSFNTRLYLYNNSNSQVASDTNGAGDDRVAAYTLTQDGTYKIEVNLFSGTGVYEFNVILNKNGFNEEERFNQNDSQSNAEIIPFATASSNVLDFARVAATLDQDDEDWFFVYLRENQDLNIDIETTGSLMANVELFDPDINLISSVQSTTPSQVLSLPQHTTVEPGSYFLRITGISGNGYHANYSFVGGVVGEASHGFDIEPNDSTSTATALNFSELFTGSNIFKASAAGSIGLKENSTTNDFFSFQGNVGDQVTITTQTITDGFNTRLYLYNNSNSQVASDSNGAGDDRVSAYTLTQDGTYKIEINLFSGTGVYEFNVVLNKNGFNEEERFNQNDSQTDAEIIPFATASSNVLDFAKVAATLDQDDEDWFFVYLRENQDLNIDIETTGSLMANVELFDPDINLISSVQSTTPNELLSLPQHTTVEPGSYFLRITGISGNGYHANYSFVGGVVGEASHGFDIEPNDSTSTTTALNFSELFTGSNIFKASAAGSMGLKENTATNDFFSFQGNVGDQVTITNQTLTDGFSTRIYLYNNSNSQVASDSNGTGDDRVSAYTLTQDGTYKIEINRFSGTGVYEFNVILNKDGFNEEERFNQNDSQSNAEIIPFATASSNVLEFAKVAATLDQDDEDWFFVYLRENQDLNIDIETTGSLMANVELFNPDITLISSVQSTTPNQLLSLPQHTTVEPGSYYLRITGISGNGYHANYSFVGGVIGEASHGFDIEPNDNTSTTTSLNFSELFTGSNIFKASAAGSMGLKENSATNDFFSFQGNVGDQVTITTQTITDSFYTRLYLYNNSNSQVTSDSNGAGDDRVAAYTLTQDGTYKIEINRFSGTGVYEFNVILNKDGFNEEERFNQNDSQTDAEIIPFATASSNVLDFARIAATLDQDDEDWFFVYLRENQDLNIDIETTGSLMANVELFDPDITLISSVQSTTPNEVLSLPQHTTVEPGSYYLRITGISGNGYHANYSFVGGVTGEASHGFDIEPNDNSSTTTPINFVELFAGSNIFKASAVGSIGLKENSTTNDFFSFQGNVGDQVTITTQTITDSFNTRLYLYNNSNSQVASDSNGAGDDRIAAYTLTQDGTYKAEVNLFSGTGVYEFNVVLVKSGWIEQERFSENDIATSAEFLTAEYDSSHNYSLIPLTGTLDDNSQDFYQLELLSDMTLNLVLESTGGWTPELELYENQVLIQTITATGPNETISLNYSEPESGNEYHVAIKNLDNPNYHAQYYLYGTVTGSDSRTVDSENNNSFMDAQNIYFSLNTATNANEASVIGYNSIANQSTQSDHYFKVPVAMGDNLNIQLNNTSSMDLDLYLVDDSNSPIFSDTASTSSDKAINEVYFASAGNLIVRVDQQTGAGLYSLVISEANSVSPPAVTGFVPAHERKALTSQMNIQITYDNNIQLGNSGNIVLFDLTNNQTVYEMNYSSNTRLDFSSGNSVAIDLNEVIRNYDPDPFTTFTLYYETGLIESSDNITVVDFPTPWEFTLGDFKKIDMGETATLLIRNDRHLWGFGDSLLGESGQIESPISTVEIDTNHWWNISVGAHHTLAINHEGDLYSFGDNRKGQLDQSGNNQGILQTNPANTFIDISAGGEHSLAIRATRRIFATGKNNFGQLGLGDQTDRSELTAIPSMFWRTVSAGPDYSMGISESGGLHIWGNTAWNLLDGQTMALNPTQIGSDTDWLSIAAGHRHALALKDDNTLWSWGHNLNGQLGSGDQISNATPTQVSSGVKTISAGAAHSLYIDQNDDLYSFGLNNLGQLGLGHNNDQNSPTLVNLNGEKARFISAGPYSSSVITVSGNVYAFGKDTTGTNPNAPIQVFSAE